MTQRDTRRQARLIRPRPTDTLHRITSSAQQQQRQPKALDKAHTFRVPLHTQIETSQSISRKRITAALQDDRAGLIPLDNPLDDRLKDALVVFIVDAVPQGDVDRVALGVADAVVPDLAGTGEELAVFVKGGSHDAVGGVECLFDAVSVVHVDVDVEYTGVVA